MTYVCIPSEEPEYIVVSRLDFLVLYVILSTHVSYIQLYWLLLLTISTSDSVVIQAKVPDTMTSWITTVIAISDVAGLGLGSGQVLLPLSHKLFT